MRTGAKGISFGAIPTLDRNPMFYEFNTLLSRTESLWAILPLYLRCHGKYRPYKVTLLLKDDLRSVKRRAGERPSARRGRPAPQTPTAPPEPPTASLLR